MLPTFVIGLREGLEAALIVGIVAAFLRQRGQLGLLRWVFAGVTLAVVLCVGVGVALDVVSRDLPQKQQEGLETVIGAVAVVMVTYMVVWMRRHSRDLKGQLEGLAGDALATGSGWALVAMAFLAVLREGFETVVFLLAAFNENGSSHAGLGAGLGVTVAVVLGYGIYRGGVRLNLSKFFRVTGVVLVLVAAGLVVTALHTAHEAGWLHVGQQSTVDLSALVRPGSVQSSLLTGMLGLQARPVLIEVIGWVGYLVPVGLYIAWPPGKGLQRRTTGRILLAAGAAGLLVAALLAVLLPSTPATAPVTAAPGGISARVLSSSSTGLVLRTLQQPGGVSTDLTLARTGREAHDGVATGVYAAPQPGSTQPATMTYAQVAAANGGRLPIGVRATDLTATVPVSTAVTQTVTAWVDPGTDRVIDVRWSRSSTVTAVLPTGPTVLGTPSRTEVGLPSVVAGAAAASAQHDADAVSARHRDEALAGTLAVLGAIVLAVGFGLALAGRGGGGGPPERVRQPRMAVAPR